MLAPQNFKLQVPENLILAHPILLYQTGFQLVLRKPIKHGVQEGAAISIKAAETKGTEYNVS